MPEVTAVIPRQRTIFDGWDGASVDGGMLNQVVKKE